MNVEEIETPVQIFNFRTQKFEERSRNWENPPEFLRDYLPQDARYQSIYERYKKVGSVPDAYKETMALYLEETMGNASLWNTRALRETWIKRPKRR